MDTSEHVPAPTAPQTTPRTHDRPSRLGRVVLAGALAGPVVHLVGSALQPAALDAVGPGDYAAALDVMRDARDQTIAWRLVSGLGSLLFVLLAGPLVALVPRGARGAVLLRVALVPLVVGRERRATPGTRRRRRWSPQAPRTPTSPPRRGSPCGSTSTPA